MGYRELKFDKDAVFLVTGGAGFIGSNLCEAVLEMGYTVRCLDNLSTGKYENIEPFLSNPRFTFIKEDIRNLDACMEAVDGVDFVLNQAAIRDRQPGEGSPEVLKCLFFMRKLISGAH